MLFRSRVDSDDRSARIAQRVMSVQQLGVPE
jgi:hypothetical protein